MSRKKEEQQRQEELEQQLVRVRLPRGTESIGVVDQRLGSSRMRIRCMDGKTRICRVPGRLKRRLWVREGDVVLVKPWELGGEDRGDLIFKYKPVQATWLKEHGHFTLSSEASEF